MVSNESMMELAARFNEQSRSDLLLLKKCSELKEEKRYVVHSFKKMETTLGDAVLAALSDSPYKDGDTPKFQVFLPKRFVTLLQNEDLDDIPPNTFYLVSHGKCGNNSTELSLHVTKLM